MSSTNIKFYKGVTFRKKLIVKDSTGALVNLTGYGARLKVYGSTLFMMLPSLPLSSNGVIEFFLSDEDTALITFTNASFQVLLDVPNGDVNLLLAGQVSVG